MIRVRKPSVPPAVLTDNGVPEYDILCADYDNGEREFRESRFKRSIYAHPDVLESLITAQHGKCCFCEKRIDRAGQVEHYRPKASVQPARRRSILRPGYYWLAYAWENLFLCCYDCNTQHKGSLFPLRIEANRARCHHDETEQEDPLLLNPALRNPEEHINWRGSVPVGLDEYGRETIAILRLADERKRSDLFVLRRQRLAEVHRMAQVLRLAPLLADSEEGKDLLADARQFLADAIQNDNAPFAAMVRVAVRTEFRDATAADGSIR